MAGFDQILAALRQMRETQDSKAKVYGQMGENQTRAFEGIGNRMNELADMYAGKKMAEGKDMRAAEEAEKQRGWQAGLTEREGLADRKSAEKIAGMQNADKAQKMTPLTANQIINEIAGDQYKIWDEKAMKEKIDINAISAKKDMFLNRARIQLQNQVKAGIMTQDMADNTLREVQMAFETGEIPGDGGSEVLQSLITPDVTTPDMQKLQMLWEKWARLGKPDSMRGVDTGSMQDLFRYDANKTTKEGGAGY